MKRKRILLMSGLFFVMFGVWYLCFEAGAADAGERIYDGVYLDSVDVGGMTYDEAVAAYNEFIGDIGSVNVVFKNSLGEMVLSLEELGVHVDVEQAVKEALSYGRGKNVLNRYREILALQKNHVVLVPEKEVDYDGLKDRLNNETVLSRHPQNATMARVDGEFYVYAGEEGITVDLDETANLLQMELAKVWQKRDIEIQAVTHVTQPDYTEDDFYEVDSLLGRAKTQYNESKPKRIANLINGTKKIAGKIVLPGEQFSMYDTVAPFTEENGYRNAGQYINAELTDGLGGGICQVSTTLYNAVLQSELQVDERYPHSMTVSYVEKGVDAAIAEGYEDFKFTNDTKYPIYIDAYAGGGEVTVAIYGHETRPENRRIEFESQVLETFEPGEPKTVYDDTLPVGTKKVTEAHTGYYVEVWKKIYIDDVLTDSQKVSGSQYNAVAQTTRIGTKKK